MRVSAPWYFEIAASRIMSGKRGGWFILRLLGQLGLLNSSAIFRLADGSPLEIPLDAPQVYDSDLPAWYEAEAIKLIVAEIDKSGQAFTLIDCGADVGLYTRIVCSLSKNITRIIAFEPNETVYHALARNLAPQRIKIAAQTYLRAVSDFTGFGKLQSPDPGASSHAFFIVPSDTSTGIPVCTLDSLNLPKGDNLMIKIDVEGAEMNVLEGAQATLRQAGGLILQIEAHPEVAKRSGVEPMDIIGHLQKIRPFSVTACVERPAAVYPVTRFDVPLFTQLPAHQIYDLVLIASP